jgi:L-threonylcarbamoyladenylate synthase
MILRPGGVTEESLRKIIPNISIDSSIIKSDDNIIPKSPGQKYRHYAPKSEMLLFSGDLAGITQGIIAYSKEYKVQGKSVGIMCTDETKKYYVEHAKETVSISVGSREDMNTIAHNLFNTIRLFDEANVDIILAEGVELSHIGIAIMNRMMKAASGKIIKV